MQYRKSKAGFSAILLGILLLFSTAVFAQPGMDLYNQGVKAAKAGNYQSALNYFEKARNAGLNDLALTYNLGVTYYKLGQYEKAKQAFTELVKVENYQQLANYNLGLIANKQNKKSEAIAHFQQAYQSGKSKKVSILAHEALNRLGVKPQKVSKQADDWAGLLSLSYASDSNVSLVNDDLVGVTSKSDTSTILSAFVAHWITGDASGGIRLILNGYMQNYSTETNYNYSQYGAGMARYDHIGKWDTRYGAFWDEISLGGSSYQRLLSAEARGQYAISKSHQLRLRYKFTSIDALDPVYDYLGGTRHQLRAGTQVNNNSSRFRAYYEFEMNDRNDYENPAATTYTFRSYSPTRNTLRVTGWWDFSSLWNLRLDGRYRVSNYNDDYVLASSVTKNRKDTQTRLSARLSRKMGKNMNLEISYTNTSNDSSIAAESYDRDLASVGIVSKF